MKFWNFVTSEEVGFVIGYGAAFAVDKFAKVNAIRYGYRTVSWIANKTAIPTPSREVMFERIVESVWQAY